ncbi:uncharacterized protein EHS24_003419 [Apiotrichum porosum]|uniref:Isochorismatase-like domain-containing protein n=1 Tax=Apiotrichum porosum TaxID=105984 RepID=A0A427XFB1_9TREE|nr:uncharacterized protein EHS24_003419 [Apiotrichum porosum]RSH77447.1 hypothetical protein EHS24_003419 [Apiotrichum porosum]
MTALLVIDMQRHFTTSAAPITANVNLLIDHFHSDDLTVVYTQHGHTPAQLSGAEVSELVRFWGPDGSIHRFAESWHLLPDLLPPATSDVQVQDKDTYDAFIHTGLEETLRARRIERVVVCGVLTNFCCETTARSAFNRGFETWVASDACGAESQTLHSNSLRALAAGFGEVLSTKEVLQRLQSPRG